MGRRVHSIIEITKQVLVRAGCGIDHAAVGSLPARRARFATLARCIAP
jgi:hypothetical protein